MSNRDRIARAAMESEAARKEKAEAAREKEAQESTAKPKPTRRATKATPSKASGRTRIVWAVCDHKGDTVETYPYPQEAEARAEADRLTEEKGKSHFVKRDEVPFE